MTKPPKRRAPGASSRAILAIKLLTLLVALSAVAAHAAPTETDRYLREDWIASWEPTHPDYWGTQWGETNFMLPYRVMQRGKHELETRLADNWRFGGETGGAGGMFLRFFVGTALDFGLWMGSANEHHAMGHDAAAREFDRHFGDRRSVPRRFNQVLPNLFRGRDLASWERQPSGRGPDANSRAMVQSMEMEMMGSYAAGKDLLGDGQVNATGVSRYLIERGRFFMDLSELGTLDQAFIDQQRTPGGLIGVPQIQGKGFSTDFTWYLHYLNRDRYGVARIADYKLKMGDIRAAYVLQMFDPLMWSALYAYSKDYIGGAKNRTRIPMLRLTERTDYMPSLRVFFSPFGIDYFQDNYFRTRGLLINGYWAVGDNRYEKRYGAGVEIEKIALPRNGQAGFFVSLYRQPFLNRITRQGALTAGELGKTHLAYNVGGSLQIPVWVFEGGNDPRRLFLYTRLGYKNLSWIPGEYLGAGFYAQTGLGVRL